MEGREIVSKERKGCVKVVGAGRWVLTYIPEREDYQH